jgi:hypothetical protein
MVSVFRKANVVAWVFRSNAEPPFQPFFVMAGLDQVKPGHDALNPPKAAPPIRPTAGL